MDSGHGNDLEVLTWWGIAALAAMTRLIPLAVQRWRPHWRYSRLFKVLHWGASFATGATYTYVKMFFSPAEAARNVFDPVVLLRVLEQYARVFVSTFALHAYSSVENQRLQRVASLVLVVVMALCHGNTCVEFWYQLEWAERVLSLLPICGVVFCIWDNMRKQSFWRSVEDWQSILKKGRIESSEQALPLENDDAKAISSTKGSQSDVTRAKMDLKPDHEQG